MPNPATLLRAARAAAITTRRLLAEHALNSVFRHSLSSGALDELEGRCLRIRVSDLNLDYDIRCASRRLLIERRVNNADVTLEGSLQDFLLLATRHTDPDTLFFQRRLRISGDTALGLCCKNAMDAIDFDAWPTGAQKLLAFIGDICAETAAEDRPAPPFRQVRSNER